MLANHYFKSFFRDHLIKKKIFPYRQFQFISLFFQKNQNQKNNIFREKERPQYIDKKSKKYFKNTITRCFLKKTSPTGLRPRSDSGKAESNLVGVAREKS
ncbi:MAG: hypothetical protein ACK5NG_09595, partial [Chthoniobacterales bacterium]